MSKAPKFTAEERAAMRERQRELKAEAEGADGEREVQSQIARMDASAALRSPDSPDVDTITLTLPDGATREVPCGTLPRDVVASVPMLVPGPSRVAGTNPNSPDNVVTARAPGQVFWLRTIPGVAFPSRSTAGTVASMTQGQQRPLQRRVRGGISPPSHRRPATQRSPPTGFAAARGRGEGSIRGDQCKGVGRAISARARA